MGLDAIYDAPRAGRPREISALERVAIEQLACTEPAGVGLEMTHCPHGVWPRWRGSEVWYRILPIPRSR